MQEPFTSPPTCENTSANLATSLTTVAADYGVEETPFTASMLNEETIVIPTLTPTPPGLSLIGLPLTLPQQTIGNPLLNNLSAIQPEGKGEESQSSSSFMAEKIDEEQEIGYELEVIDPFAHAPRLLKGAITIGKVLGHGAFGEVYQGDWQGKPVALKKIDLAHAKKSLPQLDEHQILESLQWEVSRLSTVSHPQLVSFYGIYEIDNVTYLVMEFCPGGDLQKRLAKGNVSRSKRWQWALEITQGLAYLHEQGVLHRDLKAENVLLDVNDRAKLADLGVAQVDALLQDKEAQVVAEGLQDKKFIAPENAKQQTEKQPTLSTKETDIYALGLVFWQLVTGQVPRRLIELSKVEYQAWYFGKGLREPIPSDCSESFRKLILVCWAHDPNQRIKLPALCEQLKQLAGEFHPYPQEALLLESLDSLLHSKRSAGLAYVPSMVTQYPVNESLDTYWRGWESSKLSEEEAKFRNPPLKLVDTLESFLQQPGSGTLLLLGESGLGKTLSVYQWANQLLNQGWTYCDRTSKQPQGYLPLLVRPALNQWTQADLKAGLAKTLGFYGLPQNTALPLLLILDGYDECVGEGASTNLAEQLGLPTQSPIKLVVTCRPETVPTHELNQRFASNGQLQTCYFLPFSLDQLFRYMSKQLLWLEEVYQTYQAALTNNTALRSVLRNPFVLSLCVESWPIISKKNVTRLNRWQIYESFVEHVLATHSNLLSSTVKKQLCLSETSLLGSFNRMAAGTAFKMFQTKAPIFTQESAKASASNWLMLENCVAQDSQRRFALRQKALAAKQNQTQTARRSLLSEADYVAIQVWRSQQFQQYLPLQHKTFGYEFSHKSFFEYFTAKRLLQLSQLSAKKTQKIAQRLLSKRSVQEEPEVLAFWAEGWQASSKHHKLIEPLFGVVTASRNHPQKGLTASNAATLLASARVPFLGRDLQGVHIPHANLSRAMCGATQFRGANLQGVNFTQAYLSEANLMDANLQSVTFGEYPRLKPEYPVYCIAYHPNGAMMAVASGKKITLYQKKITNDADTFGEAPYFKWCTLEGRSDDVLSVSFNPDGLRLASGSKDKTVKLWDAQTAELLHVLKGHTEWVNSVSFSPDGLLLASGSVDKTLRLWDAQSAKLLHVLEGHTNIVRSVSFSPDGLLLASGSFDKTLRLWDTQTAKALHVLEGHTDEVWSVSFSPDGTRIASGGGKFRCNDCTVRLWDAKTAELLHVLKGHTDGVTSVSFSPDGLRLASGCEDNTVRLWDAKTAKLLHVFEGHTSKVSSVSFSPDGKTLASGSQDNTVRLWDAQIAQALHVVLKEHMGSVKSVSFSPDGLLLASGSVDKTLRLWDIQTAKALHVLKGHSDSVWSVSFSPDGLRLASGSGDKTVRLWDAQSAKLLHVLEGHTNIVRSVSFSSDGLFLASAGSVDQTVRLWDAQTAELLHVLKGHTGWVESVSFSPDGIRLASGSVDKTLRLWDAQSAKLLHVLEGHKDFVKSVLFSPDGLRLASGSWDQAVRLWDAKTLKLLHVLEGHTDSVESMSFSPDGLRLASGSRDCTVRLWNAQTAKLLHVLKGHTDGVTSVSFSPNDTHLASGSGDCAVFLWSQIVNSWGEEKWIVVHRLSRTSPLTLSNTLLSGAILSESNRLLLEERGANFKRHSEIPIQNKLEIPETQVLNDQKKRGEADKHTKQPVNEAYSEACYALAKAYQKGSGVTQNYQKAAQYYQWALLQEHKKAKQKQQQLLKAHPELKESMTVLKLPHVLPVSANKSKAMKPMKHSIFCKTSTHLFTSFFSVNVKDLPEIGKRIARYLAQRDRQSMGCVHQASYQFFQQPLPPPRPTSPYLPDKTQGNKAIEEKEKCVMM